MKPTLPASGAHCRFRDADAGDAAAVAGLFAAHLRELGYEADPDLDADMQDFPSGYGGAGGRFLVAVDGHDRVVGMAGIRDGEIRRLYVGPGHRGGGLGRRLVQELAGRWLETHGGRVRAVVARSNLAARRLFQRCGFTATGRAPADDRMRHCEIFERAFSCGS
ncbi:MAG TPA: GNAT family N-acetyltransferase [Candidatus Paceibacterota bacterium]|nr:GNAT family N-acetyltransferase [Verrucomicrobiota bacterium]HOX04044.1 GNAT family N-acetyltransferase [Verrucomicrobiota bacterium]HRZ46967.1 GNAT family N-acetyltransferase [Candidatus Paceibacterota bacterium]HRZ94156.1 GNAT family N-acetyltransferase [Candidatus Paceibacterota bacterium]